MPLYCFTTDDEKSKEKTIEGFFPMDDIPQFVRVTAWGEVASVGLYEPIADDMVVFTRDLAAEWKSGPRSGNKGEWPIVCYASGVHADQAQELRDHFKKHSCQTDVTSDGDPVYRDAQHRKRALRCRGLHDKASFGT